MHARPPAFPFSMITLLMAWTAFHAHAETAFKPAVTRSTAANRIAERPDYAHALGGEWRWLEAGFESRTRYEVRTNDYTSGLLSDDALVTRNLLYLGVKTALDPLRMVVELQDSRHFYSDRPQNPNLSDTLEPLQAYAQLYFEDVVGAAPLSLSFGRMAFDWADRRLISRNRNRNTISAFDGIRLRVAHENAPWEIDAIAMRPVTRNIQHLDQSSDDLRLYGLAGYWRGWSPHVVLEPFWLWLDQREAAITAQRRNLHTLGLHAFGQWGGGDAWDYDLSLAGQWGSSGGLTHRAIAAHAEAGHTWSAAWKPRLALWLNYASGDSRPTDSSSQRFDPLYGATYAFYGYTSFFAWQNIINPALRLSFQPAKTLKCEVMHRGIWLAASNDAWVRAARRDATGGSGSYVGQELDLRLVWQLNTHFDIDLAYAHFFPGTFVQNTGASPPANLMQIAGTLRF
jgi:hypothetical protein